MLASAVPKLMGTKVTSSSSSPSSLLSQPDPPSLSPAAAAAALRLVPGVLPEPGVPRGVAGVRVELAGRSWNVKPVALHDASTAQHTARAFECKEHGGETAGKTHYGT